MKKIEGQQEIVDKKEEKIENVENAENNISDYGGRDRIQIWRWDQAADSGRPKR